MYSLNENKNDVTITRFEITANLDPDGTDEAKLLNIRRKSPREKNKIVLDSNRSFFDKKLA
jgi:hypothetical protein